MWTNAVHNSGQELWTDAVHKSKQELWPNVGHNFARLRSFFMVFFTSGPMVCFPRVRPTCRAVSLTLRYIPPMPYFPYQVDDQLHGTPYPR